MNILLINTSEYAGGAAIAANRLMKALNESGTNANMLVRDKNSFENNIYTINNSRIKRFINFIRFLWERFIIFIANGFDRKSLFQVSTANTGTDISKHPLVQTADIIHIHWINQGFLSLSDIKSLINSGKPIVWTIHDLWITNGIYHYNSEKSSNKFIAKLDKIVFNRKSKIGLHNVTFVGCSKWIVDEARKSRLLTDAKIISIPNPIDLSLFHPIKKMEARSLLSLPSNKYILLFAAAKISDKRKGLDSFIDACCILKKKFPGIAEKIEIAVMGNISEKELNIYPFPTHILGYISDIEKMITIYSCADTFIIPSLEDNLPNTIMESMSCGTPCIGFNTGGIPEMIDHMQNGYVAEYKNAEDLAKGINWILNEANYAELSANARNKVVESYSENIIAEKYIELYKSL